MTKCSVETCDVKQAGLLRSIDDGKTLKHLCPNHEILYVLNPDDEMFKNMDVHESKANDLKDSKCACCGNSDVSRFSNDVDLALCDDHYVKLVLRSLSPDEYFMLKSKHGDFYEIHDDFYDEEGNALQPV